VVADTHLITLTGNNLWSATSTCNIPKNIGTWKLAIMRRFGKNATHLILGTSVAEYFLDDTKVQAEMNRLHWITGNVIRDNPLTPYGEYIGKLFGLETFIYNQQYKNQSDVVADFINPKKAIMSSSFADNILHIGPRYILNKSGTGSIVTNEFNLTPTAFPAGSDEVDGLKWTMEQCSIPELEVDSVISATVLS
jgi:hypothetical protein